jgi:hypothetical protein
MLKRNQALHVPGGRFSFGEMLRGNFLHSCRAKATRTGADALVESAGLGKIQPHVEQPQAAKLEFSSQSSFLTINTSGVLSFWRVHCSAKCAVAHTRDGPVRLAGAGYNERMKSTSPPRPNEQRKIEKLLLKLAKIQPISAKAAPISAGQNSILRTA